MILEFDSLSLVNLSRLLEKPKKIIITTHHKPDGDALGSSLGLAHYLRKKGHTVTVVCPSEFPDFLSWMDGSKDVIDFLRNSSAANQAFNQAEIIFCLDFNDVKRLEALENSFTKSKAEKILIDHHLDPKGFCDIEFTFPGASSTCEIIFELISVLGDEKMIDQASAECLYAGIMTDTGSFRFNSTTPETHKVISRLLLAGARNDIIHQRIYDTYSESRLRFLGNTLLNQMHVLPEFNTVYFKSTKANMDRFQHESGDLEGIVNYGLSIRNIRMAVLFSERDGLVKISFRSKGDFSVKKLAETHFEGGGHKNAAGGRSTLSLDATIAKFVALLPQYREALTQ